MKKISDNPIIACDLSMRKSDLLMQNLFNLKGIDCYKLTTSKFNDTNYKYDIYVKNLKHITVAQQQFIDGFVAGLNAVL
jgi:hypothetical protein